MTTCGIEQIIVFEPLRQLPVSPGLDIPKAQGSTSESCRSRQFIMREEMSAIGAQPHAMDAARGIVAIRLEELAIGNLKGANIAIVLPAELLVAVQDRKSVV